MGVGPYGVNTPNVARPYGCGLVTVSGGYYLAHMFCQVKFQLSIVQRGDGESQPLGVNTDPSLCIITPNLSSL